MSDLSSAAGLCLDCVGLVAGERLAVVHNPPQTVIASALRAAAEALGVSVVVVGFPTLARHGDEPPADAAAAMLGADAVLAATDTSLSHTEARLAATARGARVGSMPTITEDIFRRVVPVDYSLMTRDGAAIVAALDAGDVCRITCPLGTDVTLSLRDRDGRNDDGDLRAAGAFGNLPAGEGYIAPQEREGDGVIVFDGSLVGWGLLDEPVRVEVRDGAAVAASGEAGAWLLDALDAGGPTGRLVAELGIGTNPAAAMSGNVLEDEKVRGTAHIAFGASAGVGGTNHAQVHIDGILRRPRVEIGGRVLVDGGQLLVA
jgi:leucyl aminopeptidase (aminopeptidase T)